MIISHRYRFIFLKTYKTAGTSIEVFLSAVCGEEDIVTPISPPVPGHDPRNHEDSPLALAALADPVVNWTDRGGNRARRGFYNHIPAWLLRRRLPDAIWRDYFTFCVERNPWDKTLSHYAMLRERGGDLSLDHYLERGPLCINFDHYCDEHGAVMVDRVLRYEHLDMELGQVCERLGIPYAGTLGVRAKARPVDERVPYARVYTAEQRDRVAKAFAAEIRLHGYRFEEDQPAGSATRS